MENIEPNTKEPNYISIFIPMKIKKRGGNVATIIQPQTQELSIDENPNYNYRLINTLTKAYKLQQKIKNDSTMTVSSLAAKEGITKNYLARILRLNPLH